MVVMIRGVKGHAWYLWNVVVVMVLMMVAVAALVVVDKLGSGGGGHEEGCGDGEYSGSSG